MIWVTTVLPPYNTQRMEKTAGLRERNCLQCKPTALLAASCSWSQQTLGSEWDWKVQPSGSAAHLAGSSLTPDQISLVKPQIDIQNGTPKQTDKPFALPPTSQPILVRRASLLQDEEMAPSGSL